MRPVVQYVYEVAHVLLKQVQVPMLLVAVAMMSHLAKVINTNGCFGSGPDLGASIALPERRELALILDQACSLSLKLIINFVPTSNGSSRGVREPSAYSSG